MSHDVRVLFGDHRRGLIFGMVVVVVGVVVTAAVVTASGDHGVVVRTGAGPTPSSIPMHYVPMEVAPTSTSIPPGAPAPSPAARTATVSGTTACPAARGAAVSASLTVTLGVTSQNFTQPCYYAPAGKTLNVSFVNDALNPSTKLTPPASFNVVRYTTAGTHVVNGVTQTPLPSPGDTVFTGPTALNNTPVAFTIGPLPAGRYELRLLPGVVGPAPILTVA